MESYGRNYLSSKQVLFLQGDRIFRSDADFLPTQRIHADGDKWRDQVVQ